MPINMKALAEVGARLRLDELMKEQELLKGFLKGKPTKAASRKPAAKQRRKMTAAAKAAISRRMKAYWRARRAAK